MERDKHIQYFLHNLRMLPEPYTSQDVNRVVLAFFCIHGLAILKALDSIQNKQAIISWVYSLQIPPDSRDAELNEADCGFRGSSWLGNSFHCPASEYCSSTYDTSSIATTFAALSILRTLGDDMSRLYRQNIVESLRRLQNPDTGSFSCHRFGSEQDMRFVYCACAISHMLDDWSAVNKNKVLDFVRKSEAFDGAIGIAPNLEAQGGATYCGVAALALCGTLSDWKEDRNELLRWLVFRQVGGFQGRCNKPPDSCYAFWDGAALDLLGHHDVVAVAPCRQFILSCQFKHGGFSKFPDEYPDLLHSYYSLAWLSLAQEDGLARFDSRLQVPLTTT